MPLSIILKVYDGGKLKLARAFKSKAVRLGGGDVELQLSGENVAPQHAVIEATETSAVIRALSDAPVFLNGQPILAAPLRTGDLITVGALRVMVELREPQQAQPQAPQKRQRFQLIEGELDQNDVLPHLVPSLQVVREDDGAAAALLPQPAVMTFAEVAVPLPPLSNPPQAAPAARLVVAHTPAVKPSRLSPRSAPVTEVRQHTAPLSAPGSLAQIGFALAELRWGDQLLGVHCLEPGRTLTAGTDSGCDVFLPGVTKAELVTSDLAGWVVRAPSSMSLAIVSRGETASGRELLARGWGKVESDGLTASLQSDSCGVLTCGSLSMRVRVVPEAAKVGGAREDWKGIATTTFAAAFLVGGMFGLHKLMPAPRAPPPVHELRRGLIVRAAAAPKPEPLKAAPTPQKAAQARNDPGKAFARHRGVEGEAGSKTAPRRNLRAEKVRNDAAIVADSGLMKALKGKGKGTADVFGTALATGTKDALGHLDGPKGGDARGDMGAGLKSLGGTGGGGDGSGLGLARIGTNGIGGGLADYGEGRGALKGKANAAIGLSSGKPQIVGEIDPELIRKVVHDHRAQIRACYEQELNGKPKLAGKITTAWTIDPQGLVTESHVGESTLGDSAVERCVTSRIKTWRFPLPKGGGEVYVTYPFLFTRGG